jgi:hypothetical protein
MEKITKPRPEQTECVINLNELEDLSEAREFVLYRHDIEIYVDLTDIFLIYLNLISGYSAPYAVKQFMFRCTVERCVLLDSPFYIETEEIMYTVSVYTVMFLDKLKYVSDSEQQIYIEYFEDMVHSASTIVNMIVSKIRNVLQHKQISMDKTIPGYWESIVQYDIIQKHDVTISEKLILMSRE